MKKNSFLKKFYICIFCFIIMVIPFGWFCLSKIDEKLVDSINFDIKENRNKITLKDITLDNLSQKLDDYYNDRLPFRSYLITWYMNITNQMEQYYSDNIETKILDLIRNYNKQNKDLLNKKRYEDALKRYSESGDDEILMLQAVNDYYKHIFGGVSEEDVDDTFYPLKILENRVVAGKDDWLFIYDAYPYYIGEVGPIDKDINKISTSFGKLNTLCKNLGKELVYAIVPDKDEVYYEYMPTVNVENSDERAVQICNYINENQDGKFIYTKDEFLKKKETFRLYYKFDTHYNKMAAFITNELIKEQLSQEKYDLPYRDIEVIEKLGGDLLALGNFLDPDSRHDIDFNIKYKQDIYSNITYSSDKTNNILQYTSNSPNDKKLTVVGDSFRLNLAEFMSKDYANTTFSHVDNVNDAITKKNLKEADIIVVVVVARDEPLVLQKVTDSIIKILTK